MPALQVRDLPQDIYDRLVLSAERDHRSLAQQTTYILEQHLQRDDGFEGVRMVFPNSKVPHGGTDMGYAAQTRAPQAPTSPTERKQRKLQLFARGRDVLSASGGVGLTPAEDVLAGLRAERDGSLEAALGIGLQEGEAR